MLKKYIGSICPCAEASHHILLLVVPCSGMWSEGRVMAPGFVYPSDATPHISTWRLLPCFENQHASPSAD